MRDHDAFTTIQMRCTKHAHHKDFTSLRIPKLNRLAYPLSFPTLLHVQWLERLQIYLVQRHEDIRSSEGLAAYILRLGTRRWWMVGFTTWALHARREFPRHPFNRRMGCRSQSPSEGLKQAKPSCLRRKSNHYSRLSNTDYWLHINLKLTTILSVHITFNTFGYSRMQDRR